VPSVYIYPLQYINVNVSGCDCVVLEDSGCQIPIVSNRLFSWCCDDVVGKVMLHGFGKNHTVQAPLVNVTVRVRKNDHDDAVEIPLVWAVADLCAAEYDVILPADVVRELQATSVAVNVSHSDVSDVCDVGTDVSNVVNGQEAPEDVDSVPVTGAEVDATVWAEEQKQDPSLVTCWSQAQAGKGGFVINQELLFHQDQAEGQKWCQVYVPQGRRDSILHMRERKTRHGIILPLYLVILVSCNVQLCYNCRLRSPPVTIDRLHECKKAGFAFIFTSLCSLVPFL